LHKYQNNIKEQYECSDDLSVYTCLADKTIEEIFSIAAPTQVPYNYFVPFPDEDFFSKDIIVAEVYNLSGRYFRFNLLHTRRQT